MKPKLFWLLIFVLAPALLEGQVITTFAGGGTGGLGDGGPATAASIYDPNGARFDVNGNFYFVENLGSRVRKVDMLGNITSVAGTGTAGYNGDNIPATSAQLKDPEAIVFDARGNLYIADEGNNRIRKVDITTGIISTFAGTGTTGYNGDGIPATLASIYYPTDICFDNSGNLYIADCTNYRIRKINTSGVISTYAGIGISGNSGDGGPATAAEFALLIGLAIDNTGNLFISDWNAGRIRKINSSGIITTIAGTGFYTYNGDNIPATNANIAPVKIALNNTDELFIVDNPTNRIRKVDNSGIIHTVAGNGSSGFTGDGGPATSAEIGNPGGIALDSCGNIFISQVTNPRIRKVTFDTCIYTNNVSSIVIDASISIYPNPATTEITITAANKIEQVGVWDVMGRVVTSPNRSTGEEGLLYVDISGLAAGIYFVKVIDGEGQVVVRKIIKE